MNVLILSASAKVLLVQSFREAAAEYGGIVVACDIAADNAALYAADKSVLMPRTTDPSFGEALAVICDAHSVKLVVPTRDGELQILERLAPGLRARGVAVLVPSAGSLEICRDKQLFAAFCQSIGLPVAPVVAAGEPPRGFPVFARPCVGAGGQGAVRIESEEMLAELYRRSEPMIVQEFVSDREYTIDVLMDLSGRPVQAVVRSRLLVQAGEAKKSRVEDIHVLAEGALRLCAALELVGHNVVQAFYSPANGPRYIEVNPRFGGASNLSIAAGLDSPRRILQMVAGRNEEAAVPRPIRRGLSMLRYSADMFVDADMLGAVAEVR